jgi:hypothetical protein
MKIFLLLIIVFGNLPGYAQKNTSNNERSIIYILPDSVGKILANRINKNEKLFFYLASRNDEYTIYYSQYDKSMGSYSWINNSNRKVFISGSFYPLIFNLDEIFATTENAGEVLKDYSLQKYPLVKKTNIVFDGFYITFNQKGDILKTP